MSRLHLLAALIGAFTFATVPVTVIAGGVWDWGLRGTAELGYDDNWDLDPTDPVEGFRLRITPDVFVRWETDRAFVEADVGIRLERYFDLSDDEGRVDREDPVVSLRGRYLLPYGSIGATATYSEESLVDTLFEDNPELTERGGSRTLWAVDAFWVHELSETQSVELTGGYEDASYTDSTYSDYQAYRAAVTLNQALTDETTGFVSGNTVLYRPDDQQLSAEQEQDAYYLQAGVRHEFSSTWAGAASAGYGFIRRDLDDESTNGWLADVSLTRTDEYGEVSFGVAREINPSGSGGLSVSDRVYIAARRELAERWTAGLSVDWRNTEFPLEDTGVGAEDDDYTAFQISPNVSYLLSPSWQLGASYRYRQLDEESAAETADSNAVFLTVSYVPERP